MIERGRNKGEKDRDCERDMEKERERIDKYTIYLD
jgi:hypothetical protein